MSIYPVPYYSVLQAVVSAARGEYTAIGLLWVEPGEKALLLSSEAKMKLARSSMSKTRFGQLKERIENLETAVNLFNQQTEFQYCPEELSLGYLQYLSRYSSKILRFFEPRRLPKTAGEERHNWGAIRKLTFEKLVDEHISGEISHSKVSLEQTIKKQLSPESSVQVSWDYQITQDILSNFHIPRYQSLFSGVNDTLIVSKAIDFQARYNQFLAQYTPLELLVRSEYNGSAPKVFAIGKEPSPGTAAHQNWRAARQSSHIDYLELKELPRLEEYLRKHGVKPLEEAVNQH